MICSQLQMLLELSNIQLPGIAIWNQTNLIAVWLTVGCIHKYNYYDGVLAPAGGDAWARAERASCRATDSNWLSWSWFLPNLSPPGGCCFFSAVFTVKEEEDFFYTMNRWTHPIQPQVSAYSSCRAKPYDCLVCLVMSYTCFLDEFSIA